MKPLLEAIRAKYLCLHGWKILLKCKKCGKLRKRIV